MKSRKVLLACLLVLVMSMMAGMAMAATLNSGSFASGTVTLTENATMTQEIVLNSNKNYILDLGGKILTMDGTTTAGWTDRNGKELNDANNSTSDSKDDYNDRFGFVLENGATLTVKNGTIKAFDVAQAFRVVGDVTYEQNNPKTTTLNINSDVKIETDSGAIVVRGKTATLNFDGTLVQTKSDYPAMRFAAISGNGSVDVGSRNDGNTVMNIGSNANITSAGTAIYHPQKGTLNINGGSIIADNVGIEIRAGVLNVNDGSYIESLGKSGDGTPSVNSNLSGTTTENVAIAASLHTTNLDVKVNLNGGNVVASSKGAALMTASVESGSDAPVVTTVDGASVEGEIINIDNNTSNNTATEVKSGTFTDDDVFRYVDEFTAIAIVSKDQNGTDPKFTVGASSIVDAITEGCFMMVINGDVNITSDVSFNIANVGEGEVVVNNTVIPTAAYGQNGISFTAITVSAPSLKNRAPQTGDESNIVLWAAMMALSAAVFVVLSKKARFN